MNDPNGLVHLDGRWHAFFQYNPEGNDWGNMSWGHASSRDLLHWEEHPVALPHRSGEQIYSGSTVIDQDGVLTAIYTSAYAHGIQAQSRATSLDGGDTWTPDAGNPVIDRGSCDFRDPKVVPLPHGGWLMLTVEAVERRVVFYASDDLVSWQETGSFGPIGAEGVVWECPDLVLLPVEGRPGADRWVLLLSTNPVGDDPDPAGSAMHYVVGDLVDGAFRPDRDVLVPLDHGRDLYAGVTFHNAPGGEAVMLAWMSNWRYAHVVPTAPWRGAMSIPRTLGLREVAGVPRLVQRPSVELRDDRDLPPAAPLTFEPYAVVDVRWDPSVTGALHLTLEGEGDATVEIVHDPEAGTLSVSRDGSAARSLHPDFAGTRVAPLLPGRAGALTAILDGPLLEIFADDGATVLSHLVTLGSVPVTVSARADTVTGTPPVRIVVFDGVAEKGRAVPATV